MPRTAGAGVPCRPPTHLGHAHAHRPAIARRVGVARRRTCGPPRQFPSPKRIDGGGSNGLKGAVARATRLRTPTGHRTSTPSQFHSPTWGRFSRDSRLSPGSTLTTNLFGPDDHAIARWPIALPSPSRGAPLRLRGACRCVRPGGAGLGAARFCRPEGPARAAFFVRLRSSAHAAGPERLPSPAYPDGPNPCPSPHSRGAARARAGVPRPRSI
jgi:hypothetical protein